MAPAGAAQLEVSPPLGDGCPTFKALVTSWSKNSFALELRGYTASPRTKASTPRSSLEAVNRRAELEHRVRMARARDARQSDRAVGVRASRRGRSLTLGPVAEARRGPAETERDGGQRQSSLPTEPRSSATVEPHFVEYDDSLNIKVTVPTLESGSESSEISTCDSTTSRDECSPSQLDANIVIGANKRRTTSAPMGARASAQAPHPHPGRSASRRGPCCIWMARAAAGLSTRVAEVSCANAQQMPAACFQPASRRYDV